MCGICGVIQIGGAAPPRHRARSTRLDDRSDDASRPRRPRHVPGRRRRARRSTAQHHRRRGRPSAVSNETGDVWAIQNGELYNHDEVRAGLVRATATRSVPGATRRSCRTSTRIRRRLRGAAARRLRDRGLGWRAATRRARPRSGRRQAPLLRRRPTTCSSSPPSSRACSAAVWSSPASTPRPSTCFLTFGYVPGPRTLLTGVLEAAPGPSADDGGRRRLERAPYWAASEAVVTARAAVRRGVRPRTARASWRTRCACG